MTTNEVTVNGKVGGRANLRKLPPKELARLKAERVQLVAKRLETLPGWQLIRDNTAICREHHFASSRVALAYAAFVGELSTAENVPATVHIAGSRAMVTVRGEPKGGFRDVTDKILGFAAELG